MQRQSIVLLIKSEYRHINDPDTFREIEIFNKVETWGSLKEACTKHGWSYSTIVQKKLPTEKDGWQIHRCPFRALYAKEGGEK